MGLTNRVHPYWRLATQAMQMTPMVSCTQGFASGELLTCIELGSVFMSFPLILDLIDATNSLCPLREMCSLSRLRTIVHAVAGRRRDWWAREARRCTPRLQDGRAR